MDSKPLSHGKVCDLFGGPHMKHELQRLEDAALIPSSQKFRFGAIFKRGWNIEEVGAIGAQLGFFKKFSRPVSLSVFTTKGGVLKTSLALNLARTAALHNIKTCVVGLDIQGDVTSALGLEWVSDHEQDQGEDLGHLIDKINRIRGLSDFFNGQTRLDDLIIATDLPCLHLIPETPELVAFNESLGNINRREYWIKERVIDPLKEKFDLVIMDCSPNWNRLTTNALVASDALISPLECKINNFRNFKVFRHFLREFKEEMKIHFDSVYIPTRFSPSRKLSLEIKNWYQNNVDGCTNYGIRESVLGEEATALRKSLLEHVPTSDVALEMRELLKEIHLRIEDYIAGSERETLPPLPATPWPFVAPGMANESLSMGSMSTQSSQGN